MEYKLESFKNSSALLEAITTRENSQAMIGRDDSSKNSYDFSGTRNFKEAVELLNHGDLALAERINSGLKLKLKASVNTTKNKMEYNVAGYQASVPRYLQGIPTSMVNNKKVATKQKVLHFVKIISYSAFVSTKTIELQGIKALELVTKAEQLGYRVNVDIMFISEGNSQTIGCLVNVKPADQRLNVSRAAFPIAHPSYFRRLLFKWIETYPELTDYDFRIDYGMPVNDQSEIKLFLEKNGKDTSKYYIIHQFIDDVDQLIKEWKL